MRHALASAALAALAQLSGCASSGASHAGNTPPAVNRYTPYAGQPINEFNWLGRFYSWEPVGMNELVVFTTPNDAYLLKVWSTCEDLRFITTRPIGLTTTGPTVHAGLDSIKTGRMSCPIQEIRKVDYQRMLADLRNKEQPPPPQ